MAIYKTTINSFCYLLLTDKASTTQITEFYINDLDGATEIMMGQLERFYELSKIGTLLNLLYWNENGRCLHYYD